MKLHNQAAVNHPVAAIVVAVLLLPGCAGSGGGSGVDWENYAPSVKRRIDGLAASRACGGLQREFDTAEANSDAQRARTGDGNADLMGYIDEKMQAAGCYG